MSALHISCRSTVVDLGAGTGKFTRQLIPTQARLIAIEPVAAMREELLRVARGVAVIDGMAEAIPLPTESVDAVVAAQAFHWFATPRAVDEIHRILRDGGRLGLIWNRRDLRDPLQAALDDIVRPHRGAAPAHEWDRWREVLDGNRSFHAAGERQFVREQPADQSVVVDRVVSTSFIASMHDETRAAIIDQVKSLVPPDRSAVLRHLTDVFIFQRR